MAGAGGKEVEIFLGYHIFRDHVMPVISPRTSPHNCTPESNILLATFIMLCYEAQMEALNEDE